MKSSTHQLRAILLAVVMLTSVLAGIPLGTPTAAAESTEYENFEPTGETIDTGAGDGWQQGFAEFDDAFWIAGAVENEVRAYDAEFDTLETHSIAQQPTGLTRFDGQWVVSSAEDNGLFTYDDSFSSHEHVVDTESSTDLEHSSLAPWNVEADGDRLYVANEGEVVVFDTAFEVVDRFPVAVDPIHPMHVAGGSLYLADNSNGDVHEYSLEGDLLDTYVVDWGFPGDEDAYGFGIFDGKWYVGNDGFDENLYEYHAVVDSSEPLSGTVTDQSGTPVSDAHVTAYGVVDDALDVNPSDLEGEAESLLEEIEDPLPDVWDADYDLESHLEADGTYAMVHERDDWGVGTTLIVDSSIDDPRLTVSSDRDVLLSLWDPSEGGGWFDNQVDQSFPGAAVEGTVVVEQLGPTGETVDSHAFDTETVAETTGSNPLTSNDHHAVRTQLPVGIYRVHPEGNPGTGYAFSVGDPEEIASSIVSDLEDDAGELTERAETVRGLLDDETVIREHTQTDSDGQFELELPAGVSTASVQAIRADGGLLEGLEEPSIEDLREGRLSGYNGSVYLPAPDASTHDVPSEGIEVNVYKSPEVPFEDIESFGDLMQFLEGEFFDQDLSELDGWDERLEEIDGERLERLHDDLSELVDENDDLREEVESLLDGEFDPSDGIGAIREELEAIRDAFDEVEASIDPGDREVDVGDETVSVEFPFGGGLEEEWVTVLAHTADGETDTVDSDYWTVESGGLFAGDRVLLEEYPVQSSGTEFEVLVAGERVGSVSERVVGPGVDDGVGIDAVRFSSLSPGIGDRVSVDVESGPESDVDHVSGVDVHGPGGDVNATLEEGVVRFDTQDEGVHHVRMELEFSSGASVVVSERVRAVEQSRSDPATIRVGTTGVGEHAVVGENINSARVTVDGSRIDVTAIVDGGEHAPGELYVQPESVLEGTDHTFDIDVVRGSDESEIRAHVAVGVFFDSYSEDAIAWRGSNPVSQSGDTRFGEFSDRSDSGGVLRSFTDANGSVSIDVDQDPSRTDRFAHWLSMHVPVGGWVAMIDLGGFGGTLVVDVATVRAT